MGVHMNGTTFAVGGTQTKLNTLIARDGGKAAAEAPLTLVTAAGQISADGHLMEEGDRRSNVVNLPDGFDRDRLQLVSAMSVEGLSSVLSHLEPSVPRGKVMYGGEREGQVIHSIHQNTHTVVYKKSPQLQHFIGGSYTDEGFQWFRLDCSFWKFGGLLSDVSHSFRLLVNHPWVCIYVCMYVCM